MKRKLVPPFIMLLAGAITSIVMYLNHYEIKKMLWILLAVLISFYIIGVVIKEILDTFDKKENIEHKLSDEGKVIEKEVTEEVTEEDSEEEQKEQ